MIGLIFSCGQSGENFFTVNEDKIRTSAYPDNIKALLTAKAAYSNYELDDYVLAHFEDIGLFVQNGILDGDMIYEAFSYYAIVVWENEEINRYISDVREGEDSWDVYDKFEYVYHTFKTIEDKKAKRLKKKTNQIRRKTL